ncbi:MAG TPA: nitrate reductase molybdenum cofactor assembly chaperone [Alphaproteobacteria bacterium]|nr:nitrate reductase molybdenum cofactor assembly chaperone [Alphaproteobacteria bacterium]
MAKSFKVLSALLSYPTAELKEAAPEFGAVLSAEAVVPEDGRWLLDALIEDFERLDLYELQERYVFLFDRTRSLSLHLFEHVHGESRDRGQALVDLQALYDEHGLEVAANELPDYLPLFLEFLSTLPLDEACELLRQPLHIIGALHERLRRRRSPYAAVFRALQQIARQVPDAGELKALLAQPDDDPDDLAALDRAWEDQPVSFGPGAATAEGCPRADDLLRRMGAEPLPGRTPSGNA